MFLEVRYQLWDGAFAPSFCGTLPFCLQPDINNSPVNLFVRHYFAARSVKTGLGRQRIGYCRHRPQTLFRIPSFPPIRISPCMVGEIFTTSSEIGSILMSLHFNICWAC